MADSAEAPEPGAEAETRRRSLRTAAMITAGVGAAHALLFLLAFWLLSDVPGPQASNAEIQEFYTSESSRRTVIVGLFVMPFAAIAFIWFIVALRTWIEGSTRRINVLFSNIQLVSGILYVALFCVAAGATSVLAASVEFAEGDIDPVVAHSFPQFGDSVLFVFAFRMAAMFVFTTSTIGRTAGVLPRWLSWGGYAVGLFLLLSAGFEWWFALVFPIWLLAVSAVLMWKARQIPPELTLPRHRAPLITRQAPVERRS